MEEERRYIKREKSKQMVLVCQGVNVEELRKK